MGKYTTTLDEADYRALDLATVRLGRIAVGGEPDSLLEALQPCVPVAAGLVGLVKLSSIPGVTNHPIRLPTSLLESWMNTGPEQLEQAFRPVLLSNPGDFWRDADTLPDKLRDKLDVLHRLDRYNLGEGAGYKILQRMLPGGSVEHTMMALITERGCRFPTYTAARLRALAPAVQDAVLRLGLPLVASRPILGQLMEEDAIGYVCLDARGKISELNQRAHELALRYREAAGITWNNEFMQEFIDRARAKMAGKWKLVHPNRTSILEIRIHFLSKETHMLSQDVQLLKMHEWTIDDLVQMDHPTAREPSILAQRLTQRQREIAMLLARTGLSYTQIADKLDISEGTLRKHVENIYRALNVHSRAELVELFNQREDG